MPTFDSFDNSNNKTYQSYDLSNKQTKGLFLTKVFGMMFILLLITTVVAAGLGYGLMFLLTSTENETIIDAMMIMMVVSAIALLVMSFVLPISFARGKHNILVPLIIYVVLMGVLLSSFTWIFEPIILVEAFGITSLMFGVMALLGYLTKGKLAGIGALCLGLIIGASLLSLFNFIMILTGGISEANVTLSWIVSLLVFAFLMFITLWDVARINIIANRMSNSDNNLIYYCAFILYSDFISILIRVIYYLAMFKNRN